MNSSDSLQSTSLKSKKSLNLTSNSPVSKTPAKRASQLPSRARNRSAALSIKEVRQAAQIQPQAQTNQIKSARKQILSWTAESPPPKTSSDSSDKLPEKYEILCGFFDSLDSAIRLLKLKGSMPTFTNICPKVECLTGRRFSYGHLAQLKHILPEAIEIKRLLIFDERTSCMKPDLHVSIIANAIDCGDNSKSETKNPNMRRVFRARLAGYLEAHPEVDEIPEDDLPEPFNRSKQNLQWSSSTETVTEQQSLTSQGEVLKEEAQPQPSKHRNSNSKLDVETLPDAVNDQLPVVASHVSRSFRKSFSRKATSKAQEVVEKCSKVPLQSSQVAEKCARKSVKGIETNSAPIQSPTKFLSKPTICEPSSKLCLPATPVKEINSLETEDKSPTKSGCLQSTPAKLAICEPSSKLCLPATPVKEINSLETEDKSPTKSGCLQSTPAKLASTPARLMTATPTVQPQKRCYMSPDEVSSNLSSKLVRRPPRTRSLKFDTPVKEEKVVDEVRKMESNPVDNDDDVLSILPERLLHSIREKERKAMEELDPAISQAKRRQRMIACLPKLFSMIHYLFWSLNRSVITKEELTHKIIAGHCDIADRGEVEEQLNLLLELVPEWISEKTASAGDLLVCINKMSSPESIRMRLQEAK
ncbi:CDT1-like protein a, chloroplastic [Gossypium australe]|uniref:CDT1-like protein a, chloroplastic n=1 Tax=Gossypium australe TaxID=47621 RepID=A0A5B6UN86_9ROSI|nr:CDT1-like protein a, chloroplastic [Gossypium australe]